ncbi:MAG TPA: protein TolQ [Magnetospirillaceae bacterium]|nr:protein TolQ [Magnetospirillaceae bacterium]
MDPIQTAAVASTDLSIWNLFMEADIIVKAVMVALVLVSFWCWAIIFDKLFRLRGLVRRAEQFEESFWSGGSLEELYDRIGSRPMDPMSSIFVAAMREWRRSAAKGLADPVRLSLPQRIDRVMQVTMSREMEALEARLGFLASVGSTAPFIGLFGTVWGIMNSFHHIGETKNTSLAVVAPGIAEALFATALGLVAAIPAVLAYNKLSTDMDRYAKRLEGFAGEFGAILSRQLEEKV